jgi:hypothetical protein
MRESPVTGKSVKEGIMPKEFVHNAYWGQFGRSHEDCEHGMSEAEWSACAGQQVPLDMAALKVGWSKETGHLELAICEYENGHFVEHALNDETTPRYIQVDRAGVNRMIKVLRQARDDAFGKDE